MAVPEQIISTTGPATDAQPVSPSDTQTFAAPPRGLLIGSGGSLVVTTLSGTKLPLTVQAGILPLQVVQVWASGTTATGIVALY